jgi:3-oxoacyl-ACP reductase-like protein
LLVVRLLSILSQARRGLLQRSNGCPSEYKVRHVPVTANLGLLNDAGQHSSDSSRLVGKNAIVTGASRGIGAQVARELAARGANVALCFVSEQSKTAAEALASELRGMGVSATCVQEDLAMAGAGARVVEKALAGLNTNTVHILVNNAAFDPPEPTPVHETPADLFDR